MSYITIVIICLLFLAGIVFLVVKRKKIQDLNACLKKGEYAQVLEIVQAKGTSRFLNTYIRDLYMAKAYLSLQRYDELKAHLRVMFQTQYSKNNTLFYLTLYFHIFVLRKDKAFAEEILQQIRETQDTRSIKCCIWTKEVLLEGRDDLGEEIEATVNTEEFKGFSLGLLVYLLAIEKERRQETDYIWDYLDAGLSVMQPNDLYVKEMRAMQKRYEVEEG